VSAQPRRRLSREALPSLCTIEECCAFLGCSRRTFYRLWRAGTLPTREVLPRLTERPLFDGDRLREFGTEPQQAEAYREALRRSA
jgi:hypothetical protein